VAFAAHFMHPDGSYAGEYGSRNTYHFYPHGFELLAHESTEAVQIADLYLRKALPLRTRYFNDDNRMCAHYVYDWFQAWRDYADLPGRPTQECLAEPRMTYFPSARLLVKRDAATCTVAAAAKGGVIKVTGPEGPIYSDTGVMVQLADGTALVAHLVSPDNRVEWDPQAGRLTVEGRLCRRRAPVMTPLKQIVFRALALTIGRLNPNLLRLLIQRLFITGKPATRSTFRRTILFQPGRIAITDEVRLQSAGAAPTGVFASPDATSIYVANSNTYQATNLLPVRRLERLLGELRAGGAGAETFVIDLPA
jgi:hypothetical protein